MNYKSLSILTLLFSVSAVSANGGLGIDNVNQHMSAENWVQTNSVRTEIMTQAPIDAFSQYRSQDESLVNTEALKHSYDGQS